MAASNLEPGDRLGRYEVITHLSTGGMGAVYQAVDSDLGRIVALKILSPVRGDSEILTERFRREARSAARLNHPNIVTLYECGFDRPRGILFLALEFIDGIDLERFIGRRGTLRPEETRRILIQVAKALAHAFAHGIVHRDIKPSNIMLTRLGKQTLVKLTDLGLAITKGENEFRLTREGNTVGTIDYMAPEQARDSQSADTRSDIYSLGCTAYHMLAGKPPFAQGGLGERLFRHLEMAPPDVCQFNAAVSGCFRALLEKMLAKKPEDRYASPEHLLRALKRLPQDEAAAENACAPVSSARRSTRHVSTAPTRVAARSSRAQAPAVTAEQAHAAAGLRERALQMVGQEKGEEYARQLLESALQLDPFNVESRQALRDLNRASGASGGWLRSLNVMACKTALMLAKASGDWRKLFEQGEKILACQPNDTETHLELANAAEQIGLPDLARWFIEQARRDAPENAELIRALARLHERIRLWQPAIALWQQLRELQPNDDEARRKITELSAQEMLASYQHRHA